MHVGKIKKNNGQYEQALAWTHDGRTRYEIFIGRTPEELSTAVSERLKELGEEVMKVKKATPKIKVVETWRDPLLVGKVTVDGVTVKPAAKPEAK